MLAWGAELVPGEVGHREAVRWKYGDARRSRVLRGGDEMAQVVDER